MSDRFDGAIETVGARDGESEMSQSRHMRESGREARNTVVWNDKLVLDVQYGQVDHGTGFDGLGIAVEHHRTPLTHLLTDPGGGPLPQ